MINRKRSITPCKYTHCSQVLLQIESDVIKDISDGNFEKYLPHKGDKGDRTAVQAFARGGKNQ